MTLNGGAVDPAAHGIALATHLAVDQVYLEARAPVSPRGAHEPRAGRLQRTSVDDGADGEVRVVRVDQLSAYRPMLCRGPLRPEGGIFAGQRPEVGNFDAVVDTRPPAAGDHLQTRRPAPIRGEPLNRAGGQVEARLKPRQ